MPPPARLLDLTRLVSRLGRGVLTGVDRVEFAYLTHLLAGPVPLFGLVRTRLGFLLLDRAGAQGIAAHVAGEALGAPDLLSRLAWPHDPDRARAEAAARRLALARASRPGLARLLRRHLPQGFSAINTGHANLTDSSLSGLRAGGAGQIAVLLHDSIPLDHPEFTRPGIAAVFARKLAATSAHADLVIHSSQSTRALTEAHLARAGRLPPGGVAPLGVDLPHVGEMAKPAHPYFVALGTIEPRKNHALLLDVWQEMHRRLPTPEIPHLLILGHRGWANAATFARLDSLPFIGQTVFERPGLPDAQVFALLAGACGLLFPSHAEGYGLPPIEAAALGVPVLLPPLPIYRETLGDYPVYLDTADSYSWMETILRWGAQAGQRNAHRPKRPPPDWSAHFNTVLSLV